VDTKYSITTLCATQHSSAKFKSDNLYQVYAYLRTQEDLSDVNRAAEGILLYPTTGLDIDSTMKVQGHKIRVATVNLNDPWEKIEKRLISLVR